MKTIVQVTVIIGLATPIVVFPSAVYEKNLQILEMHNGVLLVDNCAVVV